MRDGNTFLTLGNATVATQFPIGFTLANMTLETNSTVVYNANPNQTIRGDVPYQGLTARVQNPAGSNSQKTLSGPTTIRERFLIQDKAIVYDNGHQIDGTTTVDRALTGKNLTIEAGGQLVLGNASTATTFPTFGPVNNTVRNLDDNSTVVYNAGVDQTIEAGPFNYGNLTVGTTIGAAPGAMVAKTPNGTLNIDGTLTIRNNNNLVDDGQTINGNSNPGTQMIMENGSRLTIGTPTVATTFPSFSPVGNSPSEGVNAGTGKMNLHTGSTVVYRSEMPLQFVAGGFNYGSLEIVAPGATGFVAKALTAPARVKANFRIDQNNRFFDQGFQITGSPTGGLQVRPAGLLWMSNRAEMYLGSASSGTGFPTLYTRDRIDLQPCNLVRNTVYFQSDQTQNVSCEPIYGNVRLASSVAATKNLQVGPTPANTVAQIMGNLVIESNSTLDATASNLGITLGRDWVNNGVFNARAGKVNLRGGKMPTFSGPICNNFFLAGIEAQQQITSNTSNFYDLETDNTRGSLLMDNLTVNRTATFTDGHFSPRTPSPDASAPTDVNIPAATQVFIFGTNGAVAGPGAVYPADPTTNGPWHGSFVNGPVRKIGSTAFVFPTGKISSSIIRYYAPIGISDLSGSATFSAEYFFRNPSMIPYGYLPFDRRAVTDLAVISYIEYWLLDRNAGSTTARVKLSWDTPRSGGVGVPASLRVAHFNNSLPLWENRGNNNLLGIPLRGTLTSDPHGTFSPFTLGSIDRFDNLLPIELVSFEAIPQPAHVDLIWKTASETNNAYFTLEKSLDGVNFREFKRVASQNGNSNRLLTYRDIDPEPYRGISYYRLKQTDIDGKYSYSKIVSVRYDGAQNPGEFVVFPNPNNGLEINVQVPPNTLTRGMLTLHDVVGRRIHEQEVENPTDGVIRLKFAQKLAAGTYVVQIRYEGKVFSRSIVVQ
ncbi:MAG: T9SS type A sorting domain-containing protein, partial [Bernardetiaceae bacterium]|jgi:hypothetical protein|nr:T9SS type A sorting domain-containing protein [Bernardetiaceae bacterium]